MDKIVLDKKAADNTLYRIHKKLKQLEYTVLPLLEQKGLLTIDKKQKGTIGAAFPRWLPLLLWRVCGF